MVTDVSATEITSINRSNGITPAERYLKRLCDRTFLSLWSYPNIYRDKQGQGQEICDLLVVFENHVIIFSDKDCDFPDTGGIELDWSRWYKKAILQSAKQVLGAERWIKSFPDRLFLDQSCTQCFPVPLPDPNIAEYHRILVAHKGSERCRKEFGGSGSFMVNNALLGERHYAKLADGGEPFTIGRISPEKGYIHVFDDTTLDIVMGTLDTISDFVTYLARKERFLCSDRHIIAAGEEELLARYLSKTDSDRLHDFIVEPDVDVIAYGEGFWDDFCRNPQRIAQIEANEVSYTWDRLIETFNKNILGGTLYKTSHPGFDHQEKMLRILAREPRTRRRMLSEAILGLIKKTPKDQPFTRSVPSLYPGDPSYIFLLYPRDESLSEEEYRIRRGDILAAYCQVSKLKWPDTQDIIGIATETGFGPERSEDIVYYDARTWSPEDEIQAKEFQDKLGILKSPQIYGGSTREYPRVRTCNNRPSPPKPISMKKKGCNSNKPCPCGSGKKFKKCCGKC